MQRFNSIITQQLMLSMYYRLHSVLRLARQESACAESLSAAGYPRGRDQCIPALQACSTMAMSPPRLQRIPNKTVGQRCPGKYR
eukprot:scaffold63964_cov40-Prasinocladus_malaysianus.AAC.2